MINNKGNITKGQKISLALKGKHCCPKTEFKKGHKHSQEVILKLRKAQLGKKLSEETKRKIGLAQIGSIFSESRKNKISISKIGEKNPNWRGGITEKRNPRQCSKLKKLNLLCKQRDDYRCFDCGGIKKGEMEVNHIYPWSQYPRLRYDLNNLETLCHDCHLVKTKAQLRKDNKLIYV